MRLPAAAAPWRAPCTPILTALLAMRHQQPVCMSRALIVVDGDHRTTTATDLEATLHQQGTAPAFATEDEALQQLEQRATDLSLVVDLSPGSLALRAASMEADVLYYSWQPAVSMFKRVVGDEVSSRVQPVAQVSCTHSERISAPVSTSSSRLQDRRGSRHSRTRSN